MFALKCASTGPFCDVFVYDPRPLQFVRQRRAAPAIPAGIVSAPHHLWVFHTVAQRPAQPAFATCTLRMALLGGVLPLRIMSRREPRNHALDRALSCSEAIGYYEMDRSGQVGISAANVLTIDYAPPIVRFRDVSPKTCSETQHLDLPSTPRPAATLLLPPCFASSMTETERRPVRTGLFRLGFGLVGHSSLVSIRLDRMRSDREQPQVWALSITCILGKVRAQRRFGAANSEIDRLNREGGDKCADKRVIEVADSDDTAERRREPEDVCRK